MALDYLPSPSWAVIYGETPSADRWSELGENDDALATGAGMDDGFLATRHVPAGLITAAMRSQMVKSGTLSGAQLSSTGNKVVTGIGFKPKLIIFFIMPTANASIQLGGIGMMTANTQLASWWATTAGGDSARNSYNNRCFAWGSGGSATAALEASYVSLDNDGFTYNINTATSAFDVAYIAIG